MTSDRRNFIKKAAVVSAGLSLSAPFPAAAERQMPDTFPAPPPSPQSRHNMCGYAAPKIGNVRVGFIGVGNRGMRAVERYLKLGGVEVKAVCDLRKSQTDKAVAMAQKAGQQPDAYHSSPDIWKTLSERDDIDLIYLLTPWQLHTPQAVHAMEHGKHVCVEVPAATTVEECWALVETSERTKKHCIQVENCCYDFTELLNLNLAQHGFFGEVTHCEGAYIHSLTDLLFEKDRFYQMWQLKEITKNVGNLYPTHGLGPICQVLNINRGDVLDRMVSMSNDDFLLHKTARERAATDSLYKQFENESFNGMMNTSTIRTKKGKTIVLQYDVVSPRPYSRIQLISGTKGAALKYPEPARYSSGHNWLNTDEQKQLEKQYTPAIVQKIGELAKQVGGHGGMDFLMDWRIIDCLHNGLPMDMDVYDAALWSVMTPLSGWSVKNGSKPVEIPDFTRGNWQQNAPVDLSMRHGGNTPVIL